MGCMIDIGDTKNVVDTIGGMLNKPGDLCGDGGVATQAQMNQPYGSNSGWTDTERMMDVSFHFPFFFHPL